MEEHRNPEKLLKQAEEEEQLASRGKLKIYLGAAPGVGKTYTMLSDAIENREQGLDVVIGVVESHGREEIENLLKKLELLPKQAIEYRGKKILEFDLDAALKRNPGLILIDEMAHHNAPGLRHEKRWQDIKEILDRGMDVYTTLNVQHIESLNDIIAQIIHVQIKETVPDSMLELADTIELVDLPPEDLLKRLREGKVYFPLQAEMAEENFFRKGNLIALRELALKVAAERVGAQALLYRQGQDIKQIWPIQDKILVCIDYGLNAIKLIRTAKRMATMLQAKWIAVHVSIPEKVLTKELHNQVIQNLRLAEQLGAETKILIGVDLVTELINFARDENITKIIIGKKKRPYLIDLLFGSLADKLIRQCGEIDVYIMAGSLVDTKPQEKIYKKSPFPFKIYALAFIITAITTFINALIFRYLHPGSLLMIYLLGITIIALFGKIGPTIFASLLSVFAFDYFFTAKPFSPENLITLLVILIVTQVIGHLTVRTRHQADVAHLAAQRMSILHSLNRRLASTRGVDKLLNIAVNFLSDIFHSEVQALLPKDDHLFVRAKYQARDSINPKEESVAQWVYDLGEIAGFGTDTLSFSEALYLPMLATQGPVGVLRLKPLEEKKLFSPEEMQLLESCAHQIAIAIEVDSLQEQAKKSELQTETDRVRSALLHSVAHDLRTPISSIMGSASTLKEMSSQLDAKKIKTLGSAISLETEQLKRLLNNMLQISYLEAESVQLKKELYSLKEVIDKVLKKIKGSLRNKPVEVKLAKDLPQVPMDVSLITEVLINLLDNAIKFTPAETAIEISADRKNNDVVVCVLDHGPGIMPDEVNQLFEKFYRGRLLTSERGLGLGLAICRSIVSAHGGKIWAENHPQAGALFCFTLPLAN